VKLEEKVELIAVCDERDILHKVSILEEVSKCTFYYVIRIAMLRSSAPCKC
jgi:hypothetical protein